MSHEAELWAKDVKAGSGTLKAVLRALAWYADATGLCWPSQERIAEDTELSARCVRNSIQALANVGILKREERRRKDGTRQSDLIRLAMGSGINRNDVPHGAINRHLTTDQPASDDTSTGTSRQINRNDVPVLYEPSKELLLEEPSEEPSASDATVASANAPARTPNPIRLRLLDDGLRRLCAITGRSQHSARQFIGFALGIANDDAGVVLDLIEQADEREVADPTMWVERQLRRRREVSATGPPHPHAQRPTGQAARVLEVQRLMRERENGSGGQHDDEPHAQLAGSRGEDRGVAWSSGGASGPSEPVLRAAGQGGHDHRAAAALRRTRSA